MCVLCLQIEVDRKYHDQLCGLCGNFDGRPNDLVSNGKMVDSKVGCGYPYGSNGFRTSKFTC